MADEFETLLESVRPKAPKRSKGFGAKEIDDLLNGEHGGKVRKFFEAVKWAEGGQPDLIVGGQKRFDTKGDHPNIVGITTPEGPSTAAGDFQITGSNWYGSKGRPGLKHRLGAKTFGPEDQLRAALLLFADRDGGRGIKALQNDDYDTALEIARKDWAALPGSTLHKGRYKGRSRDDFMLRARGTTSGGEFEKLLGDVRKSTPPSEFEKQLGDIRGGATTSPTFAGTQPLTTQGDDDIIRVDTAIDQQGNMLEDPLAVDSPFKAVEQARALKSGIAPVAPAPNEIQPPVADKTPLGKLQKRIAPLAPVPQPDAPQQPQQQPSVDQPPGQSSFVARVDPEFDTGAADKNESVFRQAVRQWGSNLGRPLNRLEEEALVAYQQQARGAFNFAGNDPNNPADAKPGEYTIDAATATEYKQFLDENQEKFAADRTNNLREFLAAGGELTDEARTQFKELGFTDQDLAGLTAYGPNEFTLSVEDRQNEYKALVDKYRQAPDEDTRMNAMSYARRAMGWITPQQADDEVRDYYQLKADKAKELGQVSVTDPFAGTSGRSAAMAGGLEQRSPDQKERELQDYLVRTIGKYGTATQRLAVQKQEALAEAARQDRVAQMSWPEYIGRTVKDGTLGIAKSAASIAISSSLRGIAELATTLDNLGVPDYYAGGNPGSKVSDKATYKAAQAFDNFLDYALPTNKDMQGEWLAGKLPQAIGSSLGMALSGAAKTPKLAIAVMSALQMGGDGYKEAIESGATEEEAQMYGLLSAPLGITEIAGIGGAITRLNKGSGGTVWRKLFREALNEGRREVPEELAQEGFQTSAQNLIANLTYDPDRKFDKGVAEAMLLAGVSAGLVSSGVTALNIARNRHAINKLIKQEQANGVIIKSYGDGELYVFDQKVPITPELAPMVERYNTTRIGIEQIQDEIDAIQRAGRSATKGSKYAATSAPFLQAIWNRKAELAELQARQVRISTDIAERSGVGLPEGTVGDTFIPNASAEDIAAAKYPVPSSPEAIREAQQPEEQDEPLGEGMGYDTETAPTADTPITDAEPIFKGKLPKGARPVITDEMAQQIAEAGNLPAAEQQTAINNILAQNGNAEPIGDLAATGTPTTTAVPTSQNNTEAAPRVRPPITLQGIALTPKNGSAPVIDVKPAPHNTLYNSHGHTASWKEIRETEVEDRGNNTAEEYDAWAKKYDIKPDDRVIWVTPDKKMAASYAANAEDRGAILAMSDEEFAQAVKDGNAEAPTEWKGREGVLIPESDDGDNGFLFVPKTKPVSSGSPAIDEIAAASPNISIVKPAGGESDLPSAMTEGKRLPGVGQFERNKFVIDRTQSPEQARANLQKAVDLWNDSTFEGRNSKSQKLLMRAQDAVREYEYERPASNDGQKTEPTGPKVLVNLVGQDGLTDAERKAKAKPSPMQQFLADDDAAKAIATIGTEKESLDGLNEIGKNHGLSESEVQGVIDRAREKKQRTDNERKATDRVRETRSPTGAVAEGSATTILTPESGKSYEARYVIREAEDVFPSHNPVTFQPNPDYYFTNDRHYDREEQYQKQVIDRSVSFKPEYFVTDTPTAADGPPIIDVEGNVLGGNSRAMILQRIYEGGESSSARTAYLLALHQKAKQFGFSSSDIDSFQRPVLVREVSVDSIDKQHAITEFNEVSTTDLTTKEQAVADAGKLTDEAVDYITAKIEVTGAEATLTEALNAHGPAIVNRLIDEGVFGQGERNTLLDDGKITEDGKKRIERLLLGKVFTDLGQIENTAPSVKNTLVRIISPLMKVNSDTQWNILPEVQEGIELLNEANASGQAKYIDSFAANINFLRPQGWSPQAIGVAKVLASGMRKATDTFKQYAEDMRLAKYGEGAMFEMGAKTQAEAYKDAFGTEPTPLGQPINVRYAPTEKPISNETPKEATADPNTRVVYRLGWANDPDAAGKYVGDAARVAAHINSTEEGMKDAGDTLFAYRVPDGELAWTRQKLGNAATLPAETQAELIGTIPYGTQYGKNGDWEMFDVTGEQVRKQFGHEDESPVTVVPEENHAKFFKSAETVVPIDSLILPSTKWWDPAFDTRRAMGYMSDIEQGRSNAKGPRAPITVQDNGDGTYTIVDGKATYAAAKEFGWKTLPVQIEELPTRAEFPNSLGIAREDMPQVREADQTAFIEFAKGRGVTVAPGTIAVKDLLPTQIEYNPRNAAGIPENKLTKRLLISADNRLLDGHNTLVRLRDIDPNKNIDVLRIQLDANEALELMKAFPKASFKGITEVGRQSEADGIVARFKKVEKDPGRATGRIADLSYQTRDLAETLKDEYWKDVQDVAKVIDGASVPADIYKFLTKEEESLNKKLALKKTSVPSDLLRTTIVLPAGPPAQSTVLAATVIDQMAARGYKLLSDLSRDGAADVTNRFEDVNAGYKDIALKFVKDSDPVIRELQLLQPAMFEAKKVGHGVYDTQKDIKEVLENAAALTDEDKVILEREIENLDRKMAERYSAAYTADTKRGSEYSAAIPAFSINLPIETISSNISNGVSLSDSMPSMKDARDLLEVLSSTHLSADRLSSTDMAANFFSVSINISDSNSDNTPKSLSKQEKDRIAAIDKELLGLSGAFTAMSDAGFGAGEVMAEMKKLREEKEIIQGVRAAPAAPKIDIAGLFKTGIKTLEDEQAKDDTDDTDPFDFNDVSLKSILERPAPEFKQHVYDNLLPRFAKARATLTETEPQEIMTAFLRRLNEKTAIDMIQQLEPYVVKYFEENVLQSAANESISEVDATDRTKPERNGLDSNGVASSGDVQGTQSDGQAGAGLQGSSTSGTRNGQPNAAGSNESGSNVEGIGTGTDAGGTRTGTDNTRSGDSASDGISRRGERRDYVAPVGSLTREGSWKVAAANNLDAIELAKKIEAEDRLATPEEQAQLVKFVGWGASDLANNVFIDPESYKAKSSQDWNPIRERLRAVMTPEEIQTAERSTQYAHYTSEKVIRGIWSAVEQFGFQHGSILEPGMGNGLFAVAAPKALMDKSAYTGIEMDHMTARIAQLLLPDQAALENDFIKQKLPMNHFDVAIGNPPFSSTKILADPKYKKYKFALHDYFFAKSIDAVRPGGLMVFVTSRYTMDKLGDAGRSYMGERADLLGAIRLPQTAFKANAGTEVVTDVLFFRKRMAGEEVGGVKWLDHKEVTANNEDGQPQTDLINEYFVDHPEMVLGEHSFEGSMYAANQYTVTPKEGDIEEQFQAAVKNLPTAVFAKQGKSQEIIKATAERDWSPNTHKEGSLYIHDDGRLMVKEGGAGVAVAATKPLSAKDEKWLKDYVGLRTALKQAQYDQLNAEKEGTEWETSLAELNKVYQAFVKKHGNILSFTERERVKTDEDGNEIKIVSRTFKNEKLLANDIESPLVWTLEKITDDGDIVPSKWLSERQIKPPSPPKIETLQDALMVSLDTVGSLNIDHIAELIKPVQEMSTDDVVKELGDLVYEEPGGGYIMADEYLSGNVKDKLEVAKAAAADPRFARNVEALQKVQPLPLPAEKITVQIGAAWVPAEHVAAFASEMIGVKGLRVNSYSPLGPAVEYDAATHKWIVPRAHGSGSQSSRAVGEWGTIDRSPAEILEAALNSETVTISKTENGPPKRTFTDKDGMAAVQAIIEKMNQAFKPWLFSDAERAKTLTDLYNAKMNVMADRVFDGMHLTTPGLSLKYKLHDHVKRAIWRIIQTGNTYLAHAVGAGKTLEMIVSAMEQKRLGRISKPMFIVPNHMLKQFSSEFLDAYPLANIMVADEQNFHSDNRRRFVAQAALNDLDAIILTHSSFGLLRSNEESSRLVLDDLLQEMQDAMDALTTGEDQHGNPVGDSLADTSTIKRIQKRMEAIEQKFYGRMNSNRDNVLDFEELGVDFLYVDEAHEFRKLDFTTNQTNLKGVDPAGSMRALDLLVKSRWLDRQRPGRSMVLASGTPITNTMAELYSIQRFLGHGGLTGDGLDNFDAWAKQFGQTEEALEANAAGGYKAVKRFSKFVNTGVLMQRVRAFMDVLTLSQLGDLIKVPKIKLNEEGKAAPQVVVTEQYDDLNEYLKGELSSRIKASEAWKPSYQEKYNPDPMIAIIGDGQLAAFDMRFIDPSLPSNPASKLNRMIDGILDSYHEHNDIEYHNPDTGEAHAIKGAAHIVFSYGGFGAQVAANRGFDARKWLRTRLIEGGIPADEIAFISDYKTSTAKQALFKEVREGKKKVMIGSPKNMGTGVNAQLRLKTLHYGMAPWYPADIEQPHGRIIRHGNQNDEIELYWYAAKGTYDESQWGMLARKSKAIEDAMTGNYDGDVEDISESSQYAMASALASGDPRALRLADLRGKVEKYNRLQQAFYSAQHQLQGRLGQIDGSWNGIPRTERMIGQLSDALGLVGETVTKENFSITIGKDTFNNESDKNNAEIGLVLRNAIAQAMKANKTKVIDSKRSVTVEIAKVLGKFPIVAEVNAGLGGIYVDVAIKTGEITTSLSDSHIYTERLGDISESGLISRIYNAMNGLTDRKAQAESRLTELQEERKNVVASLERKFEYEKELHDAQAETNQLTLEMTNAGIELPPASITAAELKELQFNYGPTRQFDTADLTDQGSLKSVLEKDRPAFDEWFGDSKVVDKKGNPLVVYHGTHQNFDAFEALALRDFPDAIYFSSSPAVADSYAGVTGSVLPVFLSIQNPSYFNASGRDFNSIYDSLASAMDSALVSGKDGLIIENVKDDWEQKGKGKTATTYVAFNPTQIKSAIGNNGEYSGDTGDMLKSIPDKVSPDERMTVEEMKDLPYVEIEDILDTAEMSRDGSLLKMNAASHELLRRSFEESRIQAAEAQGKTVKQSDYEDLFGGEFLSPAKVQETIEILRSKAAEAESYNYPDEQVQTFKDHADMLEAAAAEGQGTVVVFILDSKLPHELFHQTDYIGAAEKTLLNRHTPEYKTKLDQHAIRQILWDKHYSKYNEYKRYTSQKALNATLRAEIPAFLLESSDAELAAMGITPEMQADYMLMWFEGYAAKNGIESLDHFDKEELDVQDFIAQVKEAYKQNGPTRKKGQNNNGGIERSGEASSDVAGNTSGQSGTLAESPGIRLTAETHFGRRIEKREIEKELGFDKDTRLRSLPLTLRRAGIEALDAAYEVFHDPAAIEAAQDLLDEHGMEGSIALLRNMPAKGLGAEHGILSFMLMKALQNHAASIRDTDPETARKHFELSLELAREHAVMATSLGQYTRVPSIIGPSVETLMYAIQGIIEARGTKWHHKTMTPEAWEQIEGMGRRLESALTKIEDLRRRNKNKQAQIKRLEDEKDGKRRRRTATGTANRQRLVDLVKDDKKRVSGVSDARQRLLAKFAAKGDEIADLKSVIPSDGADLDATPTLAQSDPEALADFSEVGAMMLTEGLSGDEEYLPSDFKAEMLAEYGSGIEPYFDEIYKAAWAKRTEWLNQVATEQTKERIENKYNEGEDLADWEVAELLGKEKLTAKRRRFIEKYHAMTVGAKKPKKNIDAYKAIITDLTQDKSDATAIAAISFAEGVGTAEIHQRFIDAGVTKAEDQRKALREGNVIWEKAKVEFTKQQEAVANEILKEQGELRSIDELQWIARNELQASQRVVADEIRRIKNGEGWYRLSQLTNVLNASRTMMASFDFSGALRQGGFFTYSKPEMQGKAFANMFKAIGEKGFGRAIQDLEASANFVLSQRMGIDYAVAGKIDEGSMMGEELFRGEKTIENVPIIGKLVAEGVVKWSERTYTAFLDTQRYIMADLFAKELMAAGMTFRSHPEEFKKIGDFINIATGRGVMPSNKWAKLLMDLPLFAPRYTLSRFQLINMTLNPVAYANMPPAARQIVAKQALRFYGTTMGILSLAAAVGAALGVSIVGGDPDDDDFGKITVGNTKYDIFVGMLPTAKLLIKIVHSAIRTKGGFDNRVSGEFGWDIWNGVTRFARGKLSPAASLATDVLSGKDYVGNKTELLTDIGGYPVPGKAIYSRLIPLVFADMYEAYKLDGAIGIVKSTPLTMFGVGVSNYKPRAERPETPAEKLAAKMSAWDITGESKLTKEARELKSELIARSRRGEDVSAEVAAAVKAGVFGDYHKREILSAAKKTLLEDKAEGLKLDYMETLLRYANPDEAAQLMPMINKKMKDADEKGELKADQRTRLEGKGASIVGFFPMPDVVKEQFDTLGLKIPDVGDSMTLEKGGPKTKLEYERYDRFRREALQKIYADVEELTKDPEYQKENDDEKRRLVKKAINKGRNAERKETKAEMSGVN